MSQTFDPLVENVNNIINTNALLRILHAKNLVTKEEFIEAKQEALCEFKKDFPELFK